MNALGHVLSVAGRLYRNYASDVFAALVIGFIALLLVNDLHTDRNKPSPPLAAPREEQPAGPESSSNPDCINVEGTLIC